MPDWISDPATKLYILLFLVAAMPLGVAIFFMGSPRHGRNSKDKKSSARTYLVAFSILVVLLMVALRMADWKLESDREQIVRKMNEMSEGVEEGNLNKTFAHVSESFRFQSSNKAALRARGDEALRLRQVTTIPFWDIEVQSLDKETGKAIVKFRFKINGEMFKENQFVGEATFAREGVEWRMTSFKILPPTGTNDEYHIPGL